MFDKLQQLKQLKGLQDELKKQAFSEEIQGVHVTVNGGLQIEQIHLNPDLDHAAQEQALTQCINQAMRKAQMAMAQKFQGMM